MGAQTCSLWCTLSLTACMSQLQSGSLWWSSYNLQSLKYLLSGLSQKVCIPLLYSLSPPLWGPKPESASGAFSARHSLPRVCSKPGQCRADRRGPGCTISMETPSLHRWRLGGQSVYFPRRVDLSGRANCINYLHYLLHFNFWRHRYEQADRANSILINRVGSLCHKNPSVLTVWSLY